MARKKIVLMVGLLSAALILSISLVTAQNSKKFEGDLLQTTLQVSNLSCGACLAAIETELRKHEGMVGMRADLSQGLVTVGHTADFGEEDIAQAITAAGYPARVASEAELAAAQERGPANSGFNGYGCGGSRGCGTGGCGTVPLAAK
jgi:copper chaperone CopZ